jgi:hypothetical protein
MRFRLLFAQHAVKRMGEFTHRVGDSTDFRCYGKGAFIVNYRE